jgi:TATA-binding protein-associated factor
LDTGSTATIRSSAAQQLGLVQKQHPNELYPLLVRVLVHLNSKNWETRIAAGLAIKAIIENVPQWDPNALSSSSANGTAEPLTGLLSFNILDLNVVLENGKPLLASAGKEFDVDFTGLDPKQRLALQKKQLIQQLGLGMQFMDGIDSVNQVDFFDEKDVTLVKNEVSEGNKTDITQVVEVAKPDDPFAGLSARERQSMKRKMRMGSKHGGKDRFAGIGGAATAKKPKLEEGTTVVQFKPKPEVSSLGIYSTGDEWPFQALVEQLALDLFSPQWELRHGAALGLKQVLNVHGGGIGRVVGVDKKLNDVRHQQCLEDLAVRLLCVLALDRFADYVGDQTIVPVRETCAQALGVVLQYCDEQLCLTVVNNGLLKLLRHVGKSGLESNGWAIRLAALIGLKYWMAVRQDLLDKVLYVKGEQESEVFAAIVDGLNDNSDDVRAVTSSALLPISDKLVELITPKKMFSSIVVCLWDSLQQLDDLTAATAFVMDLLADIVSKPVISLLLKQEASQFLAKLVKQLFPFFRHALVTVRKSVLNTLKTLTELSIDGGNSGDWITIDLLRLLFQNFVLEEKYDIVQQTLDLWNRICVLLGMSECSNLLNELCTTGLPVLMALLMTRIGTKFEEKLFISYISKNSSSSRAAAGNGLNIPPHDRAMINQDLTVVSFNTIIHGRLAAVESIGKILGIICDNSTDGNRGTIFELLHAYLNSGLGFHRVLCGMVIRQWFRNEFKKSGEDLFHRLPEAQKIWDSMVTVLSSVDAGGSLVFVELQDQIRNLYQDCVAIRAALLNYGHVTPAIPPLVSSTGDIFTVEGAGFYLNSICKPFMESAPESVVDLFRHTESLKVLVSDAQSLLHTRVFSSLAAAVVGTRKLPAKLNPVVRNLMNSVQTEENEELQDLVASGIAEMIHLNVQAGARANANDKIIRNVCVYLCSDPKHVGVVKEIPGENGIITVSKLQSIKMPTKKTRKKAVEIDAAAAGAVEEVEKTKADEKESQAKTILHRGASFVLKHLAHQFEAGLFTSLPTLWSIISDSLKTVTGRIVGNELNLSAQDGLSQQIVDALHVIEVLVRFVHPSCFKDILGYLKEIALCLSCKLDIVRHLSSKCIASIGAEIGPSAMIPIIEMVVPLCGHVTITTDRQGAVESLYHIIEVLNDKVLPYLIFLIGPLLGRMSDPDESVRFISTNAFAQLVKLAPLEAGVPNPPEFTSEWIERKNSERKFIGQLIGSEKVEEFELPVKIAAELRSYQKEGVSWLAFLNRYGLHGILCDDMGLGKTLQSICIITADHYFRNQKFQETGSPDFAHCPSLIVCPSPLTGHWYFEIKKYADFIKSVIYIGDRTERERYPFLT